MKTIYDLTREEKIAFLIDIKEKRIDPASITKPPLFLTDKQDIWSYLCQIDPGATVGLAVTDEAKEAIQKFNDHLNINT